MYPTAEITANMQKTTEGFINSFDGTWTPTTGMEFRAPECKHSWLPTSLGLPPQNNKQWAATVKEVAGLMGDCKMTIRDYFPASDRMRAVCLVDFSANSPVGNYKNEYLYILTFDQSGTKITDILEYCDNKAAEAHIGKMIQAGYYTPKPAES